MISYSQSFKKTMGFATLMVLVALVCSSNAYSTEDDDLYGNPVPQLHLTEINDHYEPALRYYNPELYEAALRYHIQAADQDHAPADAVSQDPTLGSSR
jgi:hypothetical protein